MPRLGQTDEMQQGQIGGTGFVFTGTRIDHDHLTATEYTLVTIAIDESGSVHSFHQQLHDCLIAAVNGCKRSPRSDNILVRVLVFGSQYQRGVSEIHGFRPLNDIDPATYPNINPSGSTPLNDAVFSSIGATNVYAKDLRDKDYTVNGIIFIVTDGGENASTATAQMVKDEIEASLRTEQLESMLSILIGINAKHAKAELTHYQQNAGMTSYIDAGDATADKLAKLAEFVSQSVSSQSQALGTGGPSQNIAATI